MLPCTSAALEMARAVRSDAIYDLSDFTPLDYYGAHYLEMDFTEGYGKVVQDFLRAD